MKIIIVGCGKVGLTLADQLRQEGHTITLVDLDKERLTDAVNSLDVQGVNGNGTSHQVLLEAGIQDTDLLIAVTDHDELNMLSCLIGRKAGGCQTIARIRNPGYYQDIGFIKQELGLTMVINPEWEAAQDIARLLQTPSALDVDTFSKGKVNMFRFRIPKDSPLVGKNMMAINGMLGSKMLVCIRERDGEIVIPSGTTDLQAGDKISVIIPMADIGTVLHKIRQQKKPVRSVMIAGGGSVAVYLSMMLIKAGIQVKIIEADIQRCQELADRLPKAHIVHGDSTDKQLLLEEGLRDAEAFVCMTGLDEENIMLALYAEKVSGAKVVTKISRIDFEEVIEDLPLGSVIYPKNITAEIIVRYVRAMENASGNNVETLYRLLDGRVEAMEFVVRPGSSKITGVPLSKLQLKKNLLVCSINRKGKIITPTGQDTIEVGDIVVVVTTHKGIRDLGDIVRY
jgi:trk system potassium uptake protein TrkA